MFDKDFVNYIFKLKGKCVDGGCSDEVKDGVGLVLLSMNNLPSAVKSSVEAYQSQIMLGGSLRLSSLRMNKLADLEDYGDWSLGDISSDDNFDIKELLEGIDGTIDDPLEEVELVVDEPPKNYDNIPKPWLRNYKELINDDVLFPDEIIYYDEWDGRYESVLLSDGSVRSNDDGGKVMSIQTWLNKYKTTKESYTLAQVNRDGKLITVDALRIGDVIGENAYKLLSDKPKTIDINGNSYPVSTWRGLLLDYINAVINIEPKHYDKILGIAGQLSGVLFQEEGKEAQDYQLKSKDVLDNGKIIYINASRMSIIIGIAKITTWINENSLKSDKVAVHFSF